MGQGLNTPELESGKLDRSATTLHECTIYMYFFSYIYRITYFWNYYMYFVQSKVWVSCNYCENTNEWNIYYDIKSGPNTSKM